MRRTRFFAALLTFVFLTAFLRADCAKDHRSSKNAGFLITDFTISGTQALSSDELATIENELTGVCFDENPEQIQEYVKALFQDRGYFGVEVKNLRIKPSDPLAVPKPAMLEADVLEGPQYRLAEIGFIGNHAFNGDELRNKFPLKKGDLFARDKVASGLDHLRKLYVSSGFIELTFIPDTENLSNATVNLSVSVLEGRQYRMGRLEIFAKKEVADKLRAEWQLPEGAVFDRTYLDKYIDSNRSLLPTEFQPEHVQIVRDCPDATVDVRLPLDAIDPRSQSLPTNTRCDSPDNSSN
jgi:outer membrane protein assembly factor BamA